MNKKYLSITASAKYIGVSRCTIYKWLKRKELKIIKIGKRPFLKKDYQLKKLRNKFLGLSTNEKVHLSKQNNFKWTRKQKDILDGLIFSDGYIGKCPRRPFIDNYFSLVSKDKEFCKNVKKLLPIGLFRSKIFKCKDKKIFILTSRSDPYLTKQRKRWYPNNNKIIPIDLKLTPVVCHYWYVGDGHLNSREGRTSHINLYTDCFLKKEIENILIPQLKLLGLEISLLKHYKPKDTNRGYLIRILTKSTYFFLKFIKKSKMKCFNYKWKYRTLSYWKKRKLKGGKK